MPSYFFDISDIRKFLKKNDTVSGIQRAAQEVVSSIANEFGKRGVFLTYFDSNTGRFELLPEEAFEVFAQSDIAELKSTPRIERPLCETAWGRVRNDEKSLEEVLSSCDVICALGFTAFDPRSYDIFSRFQLNKDTRIYPMIHDLIPLILPAMSGIDPEIFFEYLVASAGYCRSFLANSNHTAQDLKYFLRQIGSSTPINVTPLACESLTDRTFLKTSKFEKQSIPKPLGAAYGFNRKPTGPISSPYVLCVGTMEAKKNC